MMGHPSVGTIRSARISKPNNKLGSQATVVFRSPLRLSTQTERLYDGAVSFNVIIFDVVEQASASPNQHEQPSAGMMILLVNLQVLRKILNPV